MQPKHLQLPKDGKAREAAESLQNLFRCRFRRRKKTWRLLTLEKIFCAPAPFMKGGEPRNRFPAGLYCEQPFDDQPAGMVSQRGTFMPFLPHSRRAGVFSTKLGLSGKTSSFVCCTSSFRSTPFEVWMCTESIRPVLEIIPQACRPCIFGSSHSQLLH